MRSACARLFLVLCLAAPLAGVACSRAFQGGEEGPPVVIFSNESIDMVTVYAIRPGGEARRITSVMPGRTETLSLPSGFAAAGTVTIVAASLAGSQAATSGPVSIGRGVRLAMRLNAAGNMISVLPAGAP